MSSLPPSDPASDLHALLPSSDNSNIDADTYFTFDLSSSNSSTNEPTSGCVTGSFVMRNGILLPAPDSAAPQQHQLPLGAERLVAGGHRNDNSDMRDSMALPAVTFASTTASPASDLGYNTERVVPVGTPYPSMLRQQEGNRFNNTSIDNNNQPQIGLTVTSSETPLTGAIPVTTDRGPTAFTAAHESHSIKTVQSLAQANVTAFIDKLSPPKQLQKQHEQLQLLEQQQQCGITTSAQDTSPTRTGAHRPWGNHPYPHVNYRSLEDRNEKGSGNGNGHAGGVSMQRCVMSQKQLPDALPPRSGRSLDDAEPNIGIAAPSFQHAPTFYSSNGSSSSVISDGTGVSRRDSVSSVSSVGSSSPMVPRASHRRKRRNAGLAPLENLYDTVSPFPSQAAATTPAPVSLMSRAAALWPFRDAFSRAISWPHLLATPQSRLYTFCAFGLFLVATAVTASGLFLGASRDPDDDGSSRAGLLRIVPTTFGGVCIDLGVVLFDAACGLIGHRVLVCAGPGNISRRFVHKRTDC